jgi:hypothetical protein
MIIWKLQPGDKVREKKNPNQFAYVVSIDGYQVRIRWLTDNTETVRTMSELEKIEN